MSNACRYATLTTAAYRDCPCAVRAVVYAETVERASREESTEPMKFHRFDPLPPTTQTVAASEIATATYFDLEI